MKELKCNTIEKFNNAYWLNRLVKLGVPEKLLSEEIDCFSLHQKIHRTMTRYSPKLICKDAWQIFFLSGEIFSLEEIENLEFLRDNWGNNIAHYAAWSGNIPLLVWVKARYPDLFELKNDYDGNIAHYAAFSGNPQALTWVKNNFPKLLAGIDKNEYNIANAGAVNGNLTILDWILKNSPELLTQIDSYGENIAKEAIRHGLYDILDWTLQYYPKILMGKYHKNVKAGSTSFILWALTRDDLQLENWIHKHGHELINLENSQELRLIKTNSSDLNEKLIQIYKEAIKTNYKIISLPGIKKLELDDSKQIIFADALARNQCIVGVKAGLIVLLQGLKQNACLLSILPKDIVSLLFAMILPANIDLKTLYNQIVKQYMDHSDRKRFHSEKALSVIENEINRLGNISDPFQKQHTVEKINAFSHLKKIVSNFEDQLLPSQFNNWRAEHYNMMSKPERKISAFFQTDENQSGDCVNKVAYLLQLICELEVRNSSLEYNNRGSGVNIFEQFESKLTYK